MPPVDDQKKTQRQVAEIQARQREEEDIIDNRPEGAPLPITQSAGLLALTLEQMRPSLDFLESIVHQSRDQLNPLAREQRVYLSDNAEERLNGWLGSLTEDLELMSIKKLVLQERDKHNQETMSYKIWNEIDQKLSAELVKKLS